MAMRISLALGSNQPLSRQTAWGCFTTNLALPGSGSLAAGRPSGYVQAGLALGGMLLTFLFGIRFVFWYVANWPRFHQAQADPLELLLDLWRSVRWPLLGMMIFILAWLWALATSIAIVRSASRSEQAGTPPKLDKSLPDRNF